MLEIVERPRLCRHCRSDMTETVSPDSYFENPYCEGCDSERTALISDSIGPTELVDLGGYLYFRPVSQKAS
jgi:hypothetical protein